MDFDQPKHPLRFANLFFCCCKFGVAIGRTSIVATRQSAGVQRACDPFFFGFHYFTTAKLCHAILFETWL
ncbi:hypothetical protein RchiOBHm_Chr2g0146811 [Rosa chinensis]|uniref:Uncharacterized protein n=1 Tax=Rosa chinensis TaxID=74649 RepID=A0A2P6RYZ1_ROSCH|nr:hypothetical protein RchiOBHm_Chr2g0146811 [Rosa chinensis]